MINERNKGTEKVEEPVNSFIEEMIGDTLHLFPYMKKCRSNSIRQLILFSKTKCLYTFIIHTCTRSVRIMQQCNQNRCRRLRIVCARETSTAGVIVQCFAGDIQTETALEFQINIGSFEKSSETGRHTIQPAIPIMRRLAIVRKPFIGVEKWRPLLR